MVELLVPAGNVEKLKVAVENGADAVYLGLKKFNARIKAGNFSLEELKKAVEYSHKNGVKVYVTLNTLIKNNELNDFFKIIEKIYSLNVDGVIIQETSFAKIIKENYHDLEVHASTQARLQNLENLKYFDRVILPRELSKEEIKEISKHKIPLEIFVQGALCFCVSGLCLMSSFIGQRSANRGICAQPCRKKYNDEYILSMKDLSLIKKIDEIKKLNITSIKIEGRLRNKDYVKIVTQIYRKALDGLEITEKDIKILKSKFTRELTEGFFSSEENKISKQNLSFNSPESEIYNYINKKSPIKINRKYKKIKLPEVIKSNSENGFYIKVYNLNDLKQAINFEEVKTLFYSVDKMDVEDAIKITKEAKKKIYLYLPTLISDLELEKYKEKLKSLNPDGLLINTQNIRNQFKEYNIISDYGLNIFNDYDLNYYGKSIISPELSIEDLKNFKNKNYIVLVHGNLVVMTTKNKLPKILKYDERFSFKVIEEKDYYKILNSRDIAYLDKILELKSNGIKQYYFDLDKNVKKWLDIYTKISNGEKLNIKKLSKGFTSGNHNKKI